MSRPTGSRNRQLAIERRDLPGLVWAIVEDGLRETSHGTLTARDRWLIASWLASSEGVVDLPVRRQDAADALGLSVWEAKTVEDRLAERLGRAAREVYRRRRERRERLRGFSLFDLPLPKDEAADA